jgi:hypothetical protein
LLLLLTGLALVLLWGGFKAYRLVKLARSFQARFEAISESGLLDDWQQLDSAWASEMVHGMRSDFVALKEEVQLWLWVAPVFRWLPAYGSDLALAPQLVQMGDAGTEAAVLLTDALLPMWDLYRAGDLSIAGLATGLADARSQLETAEALLARIAAARGAIPPGDYSPVTEQALSKLDELLPVAQAGLRGAQLVPAAMGVDGPRTYLLIAENEDEIRPTGGFISSAGVLILERGDIVGLSFEDSYAVDDWVNHPYPPLPMPFQQIMGEGIWLFRDANWSPDWPSSARQAAALYQIGRGLSFDGVIAIDQRAVQLLVGPLEPLQLRDGSEPVTARNIRDFMQEAWFSPTEGEAAQWMEYRKAFIGELAAAMQQKLLSDSSSVDLSALVAAVRTALDQRHILLYFEDAGLAELVHEARWDGAMRSFAGDYLMVVDANMGFNKATAAVQQGIEYDVSLVDIPQGKVTLTYTHLGHPLDEPCRHEPFYDSSVTGYADLVNRCYWDYVRVYPAAAAEPLGGTQHPLSREFLTSREDWPGEMVVTQELEGRLSLANLVLLDRGAAQEVAFWYRLPPSVVTAVGDRWCYRLLVQKQPGTVGHALHVMVQLPPGVTLLSTTPAASRSGDRLTFDLSLTTDQEMAVEWSD